MSYSIRALVNGECQVSGRYTYHQGNDEERYRFLLIVWLIEGPQGPILVDTGLTHVDEMNAGAAHVLAEPIVQMPAQDICTQLKTHGYSPEDIRCVFISHLHFDHVDQLDIYRNARIVVSKRGLDQALSQELSWAPQKTLDLLTKTAKERTGR